MSATGSYVRMRGADLDRCIALAQAATPERPFRWPWQPVAESGGDRFAREWAAAILEEVVFDGSGHVLTSYFLAQSELNGIDDPFDSPDAAVFARVFTAAWPVRSSRELPALDDNALRDLCESEWPADAAEMYDAIRRAHDFVTNGMARITPSEPIVFIIS